MSLTYNTYIDQLTALLAETATDPPYVTLLPGCIDYAELRIYRELDLLSTVVSDATTVLSSGGRQVTIPTAFVVTNGLNVLTPAGSGPSTATRSPLQPVSRDVMDTLWPSATSIGLPQNYAMLTQWSVLLGPTPDNSYILEVIGTQRPPSLSNSNQTTFISLYLPDLFLAASMIFMSGYQRNFSSSGNDPQMPINWETQYEKLFAAANVEEMRKRYNSQGWASLNPAPIAATPR